MKKETINNLKRLYDDGSDYYLPVDLQKKWFFSENPEAAIIVSPPELSPERKPGEYVATIRIYKKKPTDPTALPDIQLSSRAVVGEDDIDPYYNCQIKAIRNGLKDLGYWWSETEEEMIKKTKSYNDSVLSSLGLTKQESKPKKSEQKKKEEATKEEKKLNLSLYDDAVRLIISYRNYQGRTMGSLLDSQNDADKKVLNWFATSEAAAERFPEEVLAAKTIINHKKN